MSLTAETVTFALSPGVDPAAFLAESARVDAWLDTCPGFRARCLSRGEDGRWTDHLLWSDLPAAMAAARALPEEPAAAAFLAMIDPAGVTMRHETVFSHRP